MTCKASVVLLFSLVIVARRISADIRRQRINISKDVKLSQFFVPSVTAHARYIKQATLENLIRII